MPLKPGPKDASYRLATYYKKTPIGAMTTIELQALRVGRKKYTMSFGTDSRYGTERINLASSVPLRWLPTSPDPNMPSPPKPTQQKGPTGYPPGKQ